MYITAERAKGRRAGSGSRRTTLPADRTAADLAGGGGGRELPAEAAGTVGLPPDWPAGPLGGHLLGALGAEGDGAVAHAGPLGFQA
jgi:hypothetical protein